MASEVGARATQAAGFGRDHGGGGGRYVCVKRPRRVAGGPPCSRRPRASVECVTWRCKDILKNPSHVPDLQTLGRDWREQN